MQPITPLLPFYFTYQLGDPADTNVNYVQAIVRYSQGSAVIATMNMINVSGQRFTGNFTPPADYTGNGFYIDITVTVYTDAGYSIPNQNYPIETIQYFVRTPMPVVGGDGGGIDEQTLIVILEKMFGKHIKPFPEIEHEQIDFSPLTSKSDEILAKLTEHSGFHKFTHARLDTVRSDIAGIEMPAMPEQKDVDLYPVIEGVQNLAEEMGESEKRSISRTRDFEKIHERIVNELKSSLMEEIPKQVRKAVEDMRSDVFSIHVAPPQKRQPVVESKKKLPDVSGLIHSPYAKQ